MLENSGSSSNIEMSSKCPYAVLEVLLHSYQQCMLVQNTPCFLCRTIICPISRNVDACIQIRNTFVFRCFYKVMVWELYHYILNALKEEPGYWQQCLWYSSLDSGTLLLLAQGYKEMFYFTISHEFSFLI